MVGGALAIVALIVILTSGRRDASASGRVVGASATERMLIGVPQHGPTLGDPTAPVRVVEFADPQCPFCRRFAIEELPRLVQDYVRKGTVRIDFRALAFIGPDSLRAVRVLEAAARQDKLWNVVELLRCHAGGRAFESGRSRHELDVGTAASTIIPTAS